MLSQGKKMFGVTLLIIALFVILINTAVIPAHAQETVITLWHALPKKYQPLFNSLVNEYLATTHGLVKINIVPFESSAALHSQLLTGNEAPDIALIDTRWQEAIKSKKQVLFIEDIMKQKEGSSIYVSFKTDTFKPMWESSKSGNKLLSFPFSAYNCALMINEEVTTYFEIKKKPGKWVDLVEIGTKIKESCAASGDKSKLEYQTFHIPADQSPEVLAEFFQVFLWQWDRDVFENFMDGELVGFDGPEGKVILNLFIDMIQKHKIASMYEGDKVNTVMYISTPEEYLEKVQLGKSVKIVPWPFRKKSRNNMTVLSFLVFKDANEKKIEKIWHLLYHLCEFKSGLKWALATPYIPPNKQITLSPDYFNFLQANPGMRIFIQQLKNSRASDMDERKLKVMKILGENLKLALGNKMTVDECLEKSAQDGNKILDPGGELRKKKEELKDLETLVKNLWDKDYELR